MGVPAVSWDADELVGLQAKAPLGMIEAEPDGQVGIRGPIWPVHRLQKEVGEFKLLKLERIGICLRKDKLQFIAGCLHQGGSGLGAYADPVDACGSGQSPVGFDGNLEVAGVQGVDERAVDLQQGLAAGADDESARFRCAAPFFGDGVGEVIGGGELSSAGPVHIDKIGVAELTYRGGAIALPSRP